MLITTVKLLAKNNTNWFMKIWACTFNSYFSRLHKIRGRNVGFNKSDHFSDFQLICLYDIPITPKLFCKVLISVYYFWNIKQCLILTKTSLSATKWRLPFYFLGFLFTIYQLFCKTFSDNAYLISLPSCLSPFRLLFQNTQNGVAYKQLNFISHRLGGGRSETRWHHSSLKVLSQVTDFLLCHYRTEMARNLSGVVFIMALLSFIRSPPLWLKHQPECPIP